MVQIANEPLCSTPRWHRRGSRRAWREVLLQQAAENVVNGLVRKALADDDHRSSRLAVARQTRRSSKSGESPARLRKDPPITPAPRFFPESPCGRPILLCRRENEGMLEMEPIKDRPGHGGGKSCQCRGFLRQSGRRCPEPYRTGNAQRYHLSVDRPRAEGEVSGAG